MSPAYNQAASDKSNLCAVLTIIQKIEKEKKKNIRKKIRKLFSPLLKYGNTILYNHDENRGHSPITWEKTKNITSWNMGGLSLWERVA